MQEPQVYAFLPAGAQTGKSGRPQCIGRLDILQKEEVQRAAAGGVGFGLELKGPDRAMKAGFEADWLEGHPYTVHLGNEDLSNLKKAEEEKNSEIIDNHQELMDWLGTLKPAPECVVVHGPRFNVEPPALDEHRYDWRVNPNDFIALQEWTIVWMLDHCKINPSLETVASLQYVGPPAYGPKWAPITYNEHRIGTHPQDLLHVALQTGSTPTVDFEHLFFSLNFLNRDGNYADFETDKSWVDDRFIEFESHFGYVAQMGRPPIAWCRIDMINAIDLIDAIHYHVGGLHNDVIPNTDEPPAEYLAELEKMLAPYPGMFDRVRALKVGSHAPVDPQDALLVACLGQAIKVGGRTFLVETSGRTPNDCWFFAPDDEPEASYLRLIKILAHLIS